MANVFGPEPSQCDTCESTRCGCRGAHTIFCLGYEAAGEFKFNSTLCFGGLDGPGPDDCIAEGCKKNVGLKCTLGREGRNAELEKARKPQVVERCATFDDLDEIDELLETKWERIKLWKKIVAILKRGRKNRK